jgi:hypothetical protein
MKMTHYYWTAFTIALVMITPLVSINVVADDVSEARNSN